MRYRPQHLARRVGGRAKPLVAMATATLITTIAVLGHSVASADGPGAGSVVAFGGAGVLGSAPGEAVSGMARTPSGEGYWLVTTGGAVHAFGDAVNHGSLAGRRLNQAIVDIASVPDGSGYWLVAADGGIFAFGSAGWFGSTGAAPLNAPIVGMTSSPTGEGYLLAATDGGIFAFGDAGFLGSAGAVRLNQPIVGLAASPSGTGYWLVARDGGVFAFGDAAFHGSAGGSRLNEPIVGMASTPSGLGYWLVARDGGVFTYGDAPFHGSLAAQGGAPVVDVVPTPEGDGQWIATGGKFLGNFEVTCYALRGITASGQRVGSHVVAVDPRVIPLGTEIYVGGEGSRVALDTGGNIKGNRLDIWRPSSAACREFGRKVMPVFSPTA